MIALRNVIDILGLKNNAITNNNIIINNNANNKNIILNNNAINNHAIINNTAIIRACHMVDWRLEFDPSKFKL